MGIMNCINFLRCLEIGKYTDMPDTVFTAWETA
jgi:hypothetical protein